MVIPRFNLSSWQKDTDHFVASIQNVMRIVTQQRSSTKFVKADYVAIVKNVHDHLTCQDATVMERCQLPQSWDHLCNNVRTGMMDLTNSPTYDLEKYVHYFLEEIDDWGKFFRLMVTKHSID
jgi:hypothetical protein